MTLFSIYVNLSLQHEKPENIMHTNIYRQFDLFFFCSFYFCLSSIRWDAEQAICYMYSKATRNSAPQGIPPPALTPARFQHERGIPKSPK